MIARNFNQLQQTIFFSFARVILKVKKPPDDYREFLKFSFLKVFLRDVFTSRCHLETWITAPNTHMKPSPAQQEKTRTSSMIPYSGAGWTAFFLFPNACRDEETDVSCYGRPSPGVPDHIQKRPKVKSSPFLSTGFRSSFAE